MSTESVSGTIARLSAAGYSDDFRAEAGGLRAVNAGCVHAPELMRVDEVIRFEGTSDPDDEAIVFALRCEPHGVKGTYAAPYGADVPGCDAEMLLRLAIRRA